MNNLEKLLQDYENNGRYKSIVDILNLSTSCEECLAKGSCLKGVLPCSVNRARWLLEEYTEPDSWEKIEADAKKKMNEYWKCEGISCINCPAVFDKFIKPYEYYDTDGFSVFDMCTNAQKCDIIARCKKLAGVEE